MTPLETLKSAFARGEAVRPLAGGFPYLCAALRQAGVSSYTVDFPSTSKAFRMVCDGREITLVVPGETIAAGPQVVPAWNEAELLRVIKADQAHHAPGDLPKLMASLWAAGTLRYEVVIGADEVTCRYSGGAGEQYVEKFAPVSIA